MHGGAHRPVHLESAGGPRPNWIRLRPDHASHIADVVKGLSPEVSNLMSRVQIPSSALFLSTKASVLGFNNQGSEREP